VSDYRACQRSSIGRCSGGAESDRQHELSGAVSENHGAAGTETTSVRGLIGLIAANISLIVAVMVYMGWAYESAFFSYFHLSALELGLSVQDYLLVSLNLFQPTIVVAVVVITVVAVVATKSADLVKAVTAMINLVAVHVRADSRLSWLDDVIPPGTLSSLSKAKKRGPTARAIQLGLGAGTTAAAVALYEVAGHIAVSTYLVLVLLALGPLLLTWGMRGTRQGRVPYAMAIAIFIVCTLWAGSLRASNLGSEGALNFAANLPAKTEVAVYSTQRLALPGTGVQVGALPAGYEYRYRYEGLRLLYMSSGTYYLVPVGWTPQVPLTYILDASDQMRVELY
jgi:hypothetical protein